ncbi:hypothetical protein D3C78_933790 [compost metagenome]
MFQRRHLAGDQLVLILVEQGQIGLGRAGQIGPLEVDDVGLLPKLAVAAEGIIEPFAPAVIVPAQGNGGLGGRGIETDEGPEQHEVADGGVVALRHA